MGKGGKNIEAPVENSHKRKIYTGSIWSLYIRVVLFLYIQNNIFIRFRICILSKYIQRTYTEDDIF